MSVDVHLVVGGKRYGGWKSVRVTRTIESLAGSFALEVSDRWDGTKDPWPIRNEDACRVEIGDDKHREVVIDGYIDGTDISASRDSRTLSYTGKDKAAALVECSLLVQGAGEAGHKWVYRNVDIAQFVTQVAAPHGISVSIQSGLTLKKDPSLVAHPGETGFEAIKRAAGSTGVLVVSDGRGGILITRASTTRAARLVEGVNILAAGFRSDATNVYGRYLISSQVPGTDDAFGDATRVQAEATDESVRRPGRVILIRPDKGYNTADARRRADWEARTRAALADAVTVTVQSWTQPDGSLWPLNAIARVKAPRMIGVEGDLLISQVEYTMSEAGQTTQMSLVRPDAFEPEPQAVVHASGNAWDELRNGGK